MKKTWWLCVCGLVIAILLPVSQQMVLKDSSNDESRWKSYETESARSFSSNVKRHSEGTFTSDFTRYLDKMKAKDFVHWLINTKRYSSTKRFIKEKPNILSFLPDFCAPSGIPRPEATVYLASMGAPALTPAKPPRLPEWEIVLRM
ncbi:exendin-3-like [Eublepharis macularius]|uniref:Exendin-3-like n=1 Tax=Eublepharis macularius TaxID=481883 RepID=A0AA97KQT8_EUBMA|nr:exendin-3-like [Eublepharis macularius]